MQQLFGQMQSAVRSSRVPYVGSTSCQVQHNPFCWINQLPGKAWSLLMDQSANSTAAFDGSTSCQVQHGLFWRINQLTSPANSLLLDKKVPHQLPWVWPLLTLLSLHRSPIFSWALSLLSKWQKNCKRHFEICLLCPPCQNFVALIMIGVLDDDWSTWWRVVRLMSVVVLGGVFCKVEEFVEIGPTCMFSAFASFLVRWTPWLASYDMFCVCLCYHKAWRMCLLSVETHVITTVHIR